MTSIRSVHPQLKGSIEPMTDWGQCDPEAAKEYVAAFARSCEAFNDTVKTVKSGIALKRIEARYEAEASAFLARAKAAGAAATKFGDLSQEASRHYLLTLRDWCSTIERCV